MRTLRQHQQDGLDFINDKDGRAILNHGMSTGKTLLYIRWWMQHMEPTLVSVTLKSIPSVWERELQLEGVNYGILSSTKPAEVREVIRNHDFVLANYEKLRMSKVWKVIQDEKRILHLGMDECHRTKDSNSATNKALFKLQQNFKSVVGLTGTLYPNTFMDVHGQMKLVDPTLFDYYDWEGQLKRGIYKTNFTTRYANFYNLPHIKGARVVTGVNPMYAQELADKVATRVHTVDTEDVVELPEEIHVTRYVDLPSKAQTVHDQMRDDYIVQMQDGVTVADNILVARIRLRQITSGYMPFDEGTKAVERIHTVKVDEVVGILEEAQYEPAIVFFNFTPESRHLKEAILKDTPKRGVYVLDGSHDELSRWVQDETGVLLVQAESGSESIDLTHAGLTIFFGYPRSPGLYDQAKARTRRSNSKNKKVRYYHVICKNTIDELLVDSLQKKQDFIANFKNLYLG